MIIKHNLKKKTLPKAIETANKYGLRRLIFSPNNSFRNRNLSSDIIPSLDKDV